MNIVIVFPNKAGAGTTTKKRLYCEFWLSEIVKVFRDEFHVIFPHGGYCTGK
jgi:hypothetical protein